MRGRLTAALALLAIATTQLSVTARAAEVDTTKMAATGARTEINIARIKSALKLTPEQHASWAAVESTLVAIAREQAQKISDVSQPISHRVVAIALNTTNMNRIAAVAMPLIRTLSADQKKVAQGLAQQIGLGAYAAFI
ncbi:MAG TPA: hypothetical protein VGO84_03860 [Burkholderiales bacterium]|nr:hypothetical protein [Burkholderiales bacterium]